MAVKLHRCRFELLKTGPCWRVEKALRDMGIDYEVVPGPSRPSKRDTMIEHTGQRLYPAIELDDGTWYREESKDMAQTIRDGKLMVPRAEAADSA
jgi:glutathione S-transferase